MKTFRQFITEGNATPDRREYAKKGYIHPEDVGFHKLGHLIDFYEKGTGEKKFGMVTHNNGKTIHIQPHSYIPYAGRNGKRQIFKVGHPE